MRTFGIVLTALWLTMGVYGDSAQAEWWQALNYGLLLGVFISMATRRAND